MARSDRIVRRYLRTKFLITMKNGQTWSAVLMEVDEHSLSLADTEFINPDGTRTPAEGQVFLPRADVAYMQRT
jgi:small nuclear ribonucleoprotein (snRNP)-like protein